MTLRNVPMAHENNRTLLGSAIALFFCALASVISLRLFGAGVSLTWLPLIVVALWPRDIFPSLSLAIVFSVGLFVDWANAFAPGQWALCYAVCLYVLKPWNRQKRLRAPGALVNAVIATLISMAVLLVTGRFVYGVWPDPKALALGAALALVILPIVMLLRRSVWRWLTDPDDWDLA